MHASLSHNEISSRTSIRPAVVERGSRILREYEGNGEEGIGEQGGWQNKYRYCKRYPSTLNKQSMANKAVWTGKEMEEEIALAQRKCEGGFFSSINQSINKYQMRKAHGQIYIGILSLKKILIFSAM